MSIRKATLSDLMRIMEIYDSARNFMRSTGNRSQWIDGYPHQRLIEDDIRQGHCFVFAVPGGIAGVFCLCPGPDSSYRKIYGGNWLNDKPYHVIHRMASDGSVRGMGKRIIDWCIDRCGDLRIDTHADNRIMQDIAGQRGFVKCGTIYVDNGTPRIAYHRVSDKSTRE